MNQKHNRPEGRVIGIGGIFFKAKDPKKLASWYREHLGLNTQDFMATFTWNTPGPRGRNRPGYLVWAIFPSESTYFSGESGGSKGQRFMVNYRVRSLKPLLEKLKNEGVDVDKKVEEHEYGSFGWVADPEGNRIELWEPPGGTEVPEKSMPME